MAVIQGPGPSVVKVALSVAAEWPPSVAAGFPQQHNRSKEEATRVFMIKFWKSHSITSAAFCLVWKSVLFSAGSVRGDECQGCKYHEVGVTGGHWLPGLYRHSLGIK